MIEIIKELDVEVTKPNIFQALVAKQYDMNTRFLKVTLKDCGTRIDIPNIETAKVIINAERKDGKSKGFDGVINDDGTVTVPLHSWMLELDGTVICDISVIDTATDNNKKLTTTSFTLLVEKAAYGGDDITSDPQYDVLVSLLEAVPTAQEALSISNQALEKSAEANSKYDACVEATENANNVRAEIEAGGYIESLRETNTNGKFSFWVGTNEEYNALTEKVPNRLHIITDEPSLTQRVLEITKSNFDDMDARIDAARDHADGLNENAKAYADNKLTEAKSYTDDKYTEANDYTDEKINEEKATKFIPKFEDIDNSRFKNLFVECIRNWEEVAAEKKIIYQHAKNVDKPYVINPFIYSTYENSSFTDTYRDIYADAIKAPITVGETTYKPSLNCISFCAAVLMGITYEFSRLKGHENIIGAAGYGFDIGKLAGDKAKNNALKNNDNIGDTSRSIILENGLVEYNPSDTLNINTFKHNLAGEWFYQVYDLLGLARRLSNNAQGGGDVLSYTDLRIGDIFCYGYDKDGDGTVEQHEHSMFCLGVTSTNNESIIKYADIIDNGTISQKFMKIGDDGCIYVSTNGTNFTAKDTKYRLLWVARPYYEPYSHTFSQNIYKQFRDPMPLTSDTDLNECLTVGEYSAQTQTIALSIYNRPTDLSFRLTVENLTTYDSTFSTSKVTSFLQTVIAKDGHEFVRTIYGDLNDSGVVEKHITDWKERTHNTITTLNPKPTN